MPIDIGIGFGYNDYDHRFTLKPDVYHAALSSLFLALEERTGKLIDIYGAAFFRFSELEQLESLIRECEAMVKSKPKVWKQYVGTCTTFEGETPIRKNVYETAEKNELISLIGELNKVIHEAKNGETGVSFLGD